MRHDPNALSQYGREGYWTHLGYAVPSNNLTTTERQRSGKANIYHLEYDGFWFRNEADRYAFQEIEKQLNELKARMR